MKFKLPKINKEKLESFSKKIFQDKYDRVLQDLEELESENPEDMRIKQKLAQILYRKHRYEEAVEKYKVMVDHFEKEDFLLKAIQACQSILSIFPHLIKYNLKLAALYLKLSMVNEAANQYRIAIHHYASEGNHEKTIQLAKDLIKMDPSADNRAKLAEIYQSAGMTSDAVKLYEELAKEYRTKKDYNKLLHYYELILPHQPEKKAVLKDVVILHMRQKRPERALKIMDHYKVLDDPAFADLQSKAKLMTEALRRRKS